MVLFDSERFLKTFFFQRKYRNTGKIAAIGQKILREPMGRKPVREVDAVDATLCSFTTLYDASDAFEPMV